MTQVSRLAHTGVYVMHSHYITYTRLCCLNKTAQKNTYIYTYVYTYTYINICKITACACVYVCVYVCEYECECCVRLA